LTPTGFGVADSNVKLGTVHGGSWALVIGNTMSISDIINTKINVILDITLIFGFFIFSPL
jgi:hypothetical protein